MNEMNRSQWALNGNNTNRLEREQEGTLGSHVGVRCRFRPLMPPCTPHCSIRHEVCKVSPLDKNGQKREVKGVYVCRLSYLMYHMPGFTPGCRADPQRRTSGTEITVGGVHMF